MESGKAFERFIFFFYSSWPKNGSIFFFPRRDTHVEVLSLPLPFPIHDKQRLLSPQSGSDGNGEREKTPKPLIRSDPVINRVPWTSVTWPLCVSNDIQDSFHKTSPFPWLSYSFTHTHRSISYHNIPQSLTDSTVRLIYLRVYDDRTNSYKPSPSPSSLYY